jgi:hypothetical protein
MKKVILALLTFSFIEIGHSQENSTSNSALDSISHKVIYYLQSKQPDSIYAIAGQKFKTALTKENFKSIAEGQLFPLNNFQNVVYIKTIDGINKYKVSGSPELQLLISLDKENKLETFLIQPFNGN